MSIPGIVGALSPYVTEEAAKQDNEKKQIAEQKQKEENLEKSLNLKGFSAEFIKEAKKTAAANPSLYADLQAQAKNIQNKNNEQMFSSNPSSGLSAGGKYADKLTNVPDLLPANNQNGGILGALASAVQNLFGSQSTQKSNAVDSTKPIGQTTQAPTTQAASGSTKAEAPEDKYLAMIANGEKLNEKEAADFEKIMGVSYNDFVALKGTLSEGISDKPNSMFNAEEMKKLGLDTNVQPKPISKARTEELTAKQKNGTITEAEMKELSAGFLAKNSDVQNYKPSALTSLMQNVDSTKLTACIEEAQKMGSLDTNNPAYTSLNADEKKALLLLAATTLETNPTEAQKDKKEHGVNPNSANIALGELEQSKN